MAMRTAEYAHQRARAVLKFRNGINDLDFHDATPRLRRIVVEMLIQPNGCIQWQVTGRQTSVGISANLEQAKRATASLIDIEAHK